jgi:hypothetical protein
MRQELNVEEYVSNVNEQARLHNEMKDLREIIKCQNKTIISEQNKKNEFCSELIEYLKDKKNYVPLDVSDSIKRLLCKYELEK